MCSLRNAHTVLDLLQSGSSVLALFFHPKVLMRHMIPHSPLLSVSAIQVIVFSCLSMQLQWQCKRLILTCCFSSCFCKVRIRQDWIEILINLSQNLPQSPLKYLGCLVLYRESSFVIILSLPLSREYYSMLCCTVTYHIMLCRTVTYHIMLCRTVTYHIMLRCAVTYDSMLRHIVLQMFANMFLLQGMHLNLNLNANSSDECSQRDQYPHQYQNLSCNRTNAMNQTAEVSTVYDCSFKTKVCVYCISQMWQ